MNKRKQEIEKRRILNQKRLFSEKHKQNISLALKGKHNSKKTEFKKGDIPWNKGKKHMSGKKHPMWKNGKYNSRGYVLIYSPNHPHKRRNYVLEHRLIMEKRLNRYLKPLEVVHHINEIKDDNRIDNLMLFKNVKEHSSFHIKIKQFGMTNPIKRQIKNRWKKLNN